MLLNAFNMFFQEVCFDRHLTLYFCIIFRRCVRIPLRCRITGMSYFANELMVSTSAKVIFLRYSYIVLSRNVRETLLSFVAVVPFYYFNRVLQNK